MCLCGAQCYGLSHITRICLIADRTQCGCLGGFTEEEGDEWDPFIAVNCSLSHALMASMSMDKSA